jgi:hypothetical protein
MRRDGRALQERLVRALEGAPELAPGIERSMVLALWCRTPLAAHADARALDVRCARADGPHPDSND